MKFTAADGASGSSESTNGLADGDGKQVSDDNGDEDYHADESQGLAIQFGDASVGASFGETALSDHRPVHFWKGAVGPDHFGMAIIFSFDEMHGFGATQFLRKRTHARHHRRVGADIFARSEFAGVVMGDDVTLMVNHENTAAADASVFQAMKNRIQRDDCRDHSSELLIDVQRNGNDEGRLIIGFEGQ